jgi:hypothetical protein
MGGSNVPDTPPADIDGDGMDDSAVAQALACIGPQGIDGCGYESTLDSMMNALDPEAEWNQGDDPFLRAGGLLAVAIITDEEDCSVTDDSVMSDEAFQNEHPDPDVGLQPSSAICWNAGVSCEEPDAEGVYSSCTSTGDSLRPVQEYVDFLNDQGRKVVMLGILGVPLVTERNPDPPYEPLAGGVLDLVYRDWRDPDFANGGDILPDDWDAGRDAAYQQWQFGIGPGCTGQTEAGDFTGQAIPPVRVKEVCQALDVEDEIRCCIESICDTDFSGALTCLAGLIQEAREREQRELRQRQPDLGERGVAGEPERGLRLAQQIPDVALVAARSLARHGSGGAPCPRRPGIRVFRTTLAIHIRALITYQQPDI